MKQQFEQLLQKDMSRHEFLATLGLGLISILGLSSVAKMLLDHSTTNTARIQTPSTSKSSRGYGTSAYGG